MKMPFGAYKGEELCDLSLSYLKWLEEQSWVRGELRTELQHEIERREGDVTSLGRVIPGKIKLI